MFTRVERKMQKNIQRRRSAEAWRELVARQTRSGLTVQEFCRREDINAWSLYGWRSRLGMTGESESVEDESHSVGGTPSARFVELGALQSPQPRCEIRLDLGGGVVLHLVRS